MVFSIQLTSNALQVRDTIGRIRSGLPKAAAKDIRVVTRIYSRALRSVVRKQGMIFTGNLYEALGRVRKTKKGFIIDVPKYALDLSFKKGPHLVGPNTAGREGLDRWMIAHTGSTRPYIRINPKPWVKEGLSTGRKRALKHFENSHLSKVVQSKGMVT